MCDPFRCHVSPSLVLVLALFLHPAIFLFLFLSPLVVRLFEPRVSLSWYVTCIRVVSCFFLPACLIAPCMLNDGGEERTHVTP